MPLNVISMVVYFIISIVYLIITYGSGISSYDIIRYKAQSWTSQRHCKDINIVLHDVQNISLQIFSVECASELGCKDQPVLASMLK